MKIFCVILGILLIIGGAFGIFITYQKLTAVSEELSTTRNLLSEVQAERDSTAAMLAETQRLLGETRDALEEQKEQTRQYRDLYETTRKTLGETQNELDSIRQELADARDEQETLQRTVSELNRTIDRLNEKLALYEDTLGIRVFAGIDPPYRSGSASILDLENNGTATNPSWDELLAFLKADKTDLRPYITGVYMCGNYACDVHNNAEAHGIRAAFVAIHFYNNEPHAINAFKTTDRGLVYIDCTGSTYNLYNVSMDSLVSLAKDRVYSATLLFTTDFYASYDWIVKSIEIYW
ncbi:MAG: hypothetical protein N2506_07225 [Dehalococcoidales bacterium]|nr:hypothetical protein [Dehalococcoidales bacterium]